MDARVEASDGDEDVWPPTLRTLRLTTRGLERNRRGGLSRLVRVFMAKIQISSASGVPTGGEIALCDRVPGGT